jgi:radical SAM/Cys-rich protein
MSDPMRVPVQPGIEPFVDRLEREALVLDRRCLETLQVNVGKLCNQACHHCHVDAGPKRPEQMDERTARRILELLEASPGVRAIDVTGGAPELNPWFRHLVEGSRELGRDVIDRCNLTVLFEPGQEDLARFLAGHRVRVVASLPCYTSENVDRQRGRGVFEKSIRALRWLNEHGYGMPGGDLVLDLVFNPGGPSLPGAQEQLEADYRERLLADHGIRFSRLLTITNVPINRFHQDLERSGRYDSYMELLAGSFNRCAARDVMCRTLVSVSWDGRLYDCDFNQMLDLPVGDRRRTLWDLESFAELDRGPIALDDHCYACCAGAGSSCGGALA